MSLIVTVGRSAIKINVIPFVKKKMDFFCIKMKTLVCVSTIYVNDFFFRQNTTFPRTGSHTQQVGTMYWYTPIYIYRYTQYKLSYEKED